MGKIADISKYQQMGKPPIDWGKVASEADLLILRVQYGAGMEDPYFESFASKCEKYGIPYGGYSFFRAQSEEAADREADVMMARTAGSKMLFYVADIEKLPYGITNAEIGPLSKAWANAFGFKKTGLYVSQALYGLSARSAYDFLWIPRYGDGDAYYEVGEAPKYPCDMHQYTSVGRLAGITGDVDLNRLTGAKTLGWFTGESPTIPTPSAPKVLGTGLILNGKGHNVYSMADVSRPVVGLVSEGQYVAVLEDPYPWRTIQRKVGDTVLFAGAIQAKYLDVDGNTGLVVNGRNLPVYSMTDVNRPIVGYVYAGQYVVMTENPYPFTYISRVIDGKTIFAGYIQTKYIKF